MTIQGRRAVFSLLQEGSSCSSLLLLDSWHFQGGADPGCSTLSSALRPHLEKLEEKARMLKDHMGSTSPKLAAAGKQMFVFKQIHVHVLANLYLSSNYLAGAGAHPTGKTWFWKLHQLLQCFGENIAVCRAGQEIARISGIQEFPPCQSREESRTMAPREHNSAIPLQLCSDTSDKILHFFRYSTFLPCSVLVLPDLCEIPYFPCLPRWLCKVWPTPAKPGKPFSSINCHPFS